MMNNTKDGVQPPQVTSGNTLISVLETRNINFDQVFTVPYCQDIIDILNRVQTYDELVGNDKYIRFTLNTPGGNIFALLGLIEKIEALKEKGYTVHTHVAGMAASCGFILFVSGNKRTISKFGWLLNHQGSSMAAGTVKDMEISLDLSKRLDAELNDYIRQNTDMDEDEIQRPYRTNTDVWYDSKQAIELKIAHEIVNY